MARVTVEDCITRIENRFDLVILASHRARGISAGAAITVDRDNDKNPVVALREIADDQVKPDELEDSMIRSLQKYAEIDEPEEQDMEMIAADLSEEAGGPDAEIAAELAEVGAFVDEVGAFLDEESEADAEPADQPAEDEDEN